MCSIMGDSVLVRPGETARNMLLKRLFSPWLGRLVGYSVVLVSQGCGFDLQLGHMQEATNDA